VAPKYVLLPHRAQSFIVDAQPTIPTAAVFVRVEHVDRIVPAACRSTMVVKYPIQLVVYRLCGFPGIRYHDFWTDGDTGILNFGRTGKMKEIIIPSGIWSSGVN
jgi:hypothetical protein